jgi:hypothetical protein
MNLGLIPGGGQEVYFLQSLLISLGPTKPLTNTSKERSEIVSDELEIREKKIS